MKIPSWPRWVMAGLLTSICTASRREGKDLVGISTGGAFEMARLLGSVQVLPDVKTGRDEAGYQVVVRVRDNLRQVTLLGAAKQPLRKRIPLLDGEGRETGETIEKPDDNAWTVAVNKAQRNGILRLVSADARRKIIDQFLARGQRKAPGETGPDHRQARSGETAKGISGGHSDFAEHKPDAVTSLVTTADFAAGCKQKGYRTSAEVCSTLGFADKRALVRFGLARAMEKLPDRHVDSQDTVDEREYSPTVVITPPGQAKFVLLANGKRWGLMELARICLEEMREFLTDHGVLDRSNSIL